MANGRYEVTRRLACGGMAEVFEARMLGPQGFTKTVALKRIRREYAQDKSFVAMFVNEARLSSRLNHPHIVQTLDLGQAGAELFLAMEYVDGPSLRDLVCQARDRGENLPAPMVLRVISQVCEALGYAHALKDDDGRHLKLLHRDISPDNVLLTRGGLAKLTDFGIAKAFNIATPEKTETGVLKGKASYLAPEVILGMPFDHRADLFALGVVLYECLAGVRPFVGSEGVAVHGAIAHQPHVSLSVRRPDLSPGVVALVDRALAKSPSERPADARAFQREVEAELQRFGTPTLPSDLAEVITRYREPTPAPVRPRPDSVDIMVDDADIILADVEVGAAPLPRPPTGPTLAAARPVVLLEKRLPPHPSPRARPNVRRWLAAVPLIGLFAAFTNADLPPRIAEASGVTPSLNAPVPVAAPAPAVRVATLMPTAPVALAVAPPVPARPAVTAQAVVASAKRSAPRSLPVAPSTESTVGQLALHAAPGLRITLDGQPYGTTPVGPLALTPGMHKVGYTDSVGQGELVEVSVSPGDRASIDLNPAAL